MHVKKMTLWIRCYWLFVSSWLRLFRRVWTFVDFNALVHTARCVVIPFIGSKGDPRENLRWCNCCRKISVLILSPNTDKNVHGRKAMKIKHKGCKHINPRLVFVVPIKAMIVSISLLMLAFDLLNKVTRRITAGYPPPLAYGHFPRCHSMDSLSLVGIHWACLYRPQHKKHVEYWPVLSSQNRHRNQSAATHCSFVTFGSKSSFIILTWHTEYQDYDVKPLLRLDCQHNV